MHSHTIAEVMAMIEEMKLESLNEIFLRDESVEELADYFSGYPFPLSSILSMVHAHHRFTLSCLNFDQQCAVKLSALVGSSGIQDAVQEAQAYVAQGYTCLKIKVGVGISLEIEKIKAIAGLAGAGVSLRLDANKKLDLEDALTLLKGLGRVNLEYFEEPTKDFRQAICLHDEFGVAIAIDESFPPPL